MLFIWWRGLPNALMSSVNLVRDSITLHYVGTNYSADVLAPFGLAFSWITSFGTSFLFGVALGISTIAAHAYGNGRYDRVHKIFRNGFLFMLLLLSLMSTFFIFSSPLMKLVGVQA